MAGLATGAAQGPGNAGSAGSGLRAVVVSIGSRVSMVALNASTGILTARMLQPTGRGELAAMIIWSLFLANATTLGLPSSVIYYLRRRPEVERNLVMTAMSVSVMLGCVAALGGAFFLKFWLHQYSPELIHAAQWFLLFTPICALTLTGRAILEGRDRFSLSNAVQLLTPATTLVFLLAALAIHRLNPYTAGMAYVFASVPTLILLIVKLRTDWLRPRFFNFDTCRLLLGYGVRSWGIDLLGTLALQVDQVLVVNLLAPAAMGSYVVVLSLSRMLNLFQNAVVMVLFPKAAGRPLHEIVDLTARSARLSTLVTGLSGLAICLVGPWLLRLLYGREYVGSTNALRVLVVEVTISGLVFVLAQAFMAMGRPGVVTMLQAVGLGLSLPMMLWLVPKWGVLGAATALLVSTTARLLLVLPAFRLVLGSGLPDLMPRLEDFEMLRRMVRRPARSNEVSA